MEIKYLRRRFLFSSFLKGLACFFFILGGLLLLGSVGAYENDAISLLQWGVQSIISVLVSLLALPIYILKNNFDWKYPYTRIVIKEPKGEKIICYKN